MSYDLFFQPRAGKRIDNRSFAAYFQARRHYTVENGQALYQNEDTGVYFIFDEPSDGVVAFNLNYFRPHTFGLEAAIELEAFAKAFDAVATDEEQWPFTRERFLKAWNEGNRFGYRAMVKEAGAVHTWPAKRIREVWEWNYTRPQEDAPQLDEYFVPGVFAADFDGHTRSVAIWPPACPVLLPAVDALLVPLAQSGKASEDVALVPWDEVLPVVKPYEQRSQGLLRYRLVFVDDGWPAEVTAFLSKRRKPAGKLNGVALDEVLDEELVTEARRVAS